MLGEIQNMKLKHPFIVSNCGDFCGLLEKISKQLMNL
jgi:hypothetical protein